MQDINQRLEKDTAKLKAQKVEEDALIENENVAVTAIRNKNLHVRRDVKEQKKEWLAKKADAVQKHED